MARLEDRGREIVASLSLASVDAGEGYLIFKLPAAECSVHGTPGDVPQHELHFLVEDVDKFVGGMKGRGVECSEVQDAGWGLVRRVTLPSGAPLSFYQPRHARP